MNMFNKRYKYDGNSVLKLNELQKSMKLQIDKKVKDKTYRFESVPCCVCGTMNFQTISDKDRYGLYMPVVICTDCGLIQTNPRMDQQAYNTFYNQEYRKLYTGNKSPNSDFFNNQYRTGRQIFNFLNSNGVLSKPLGEITVLEIGCGAGGILQYFREKGCTVNGVDLGEEYIEFGRSQYDLDIDIGNITDISTENSVDLIIYSHVLEHVLTPVTEIQHIHRVLSDDGIVYIELPGVKNLRNNYDLDFLKYLQNAHAYHFSLTTLNNLLKINGFELIVGNEIIYSIFKKSTGTDYTLKTTSDYEVVLKYLKILEILRKVLPIAPYKIKKFARQQVRKILQLLGILKR